ncbi:MAG: DUF302 domain-containing protein, partial [Acidimicrobiales bacterium]|nr:DUF302 domain-containing protein [Acidimicrobiales bacterium]
NPVRSFDTVVDQTIDRAEGAVGAALAVQGFGVLTEIDVAATFEAKLGVKGPPLKILGACNPTLAHRALELDPRVALMLPCNVVLRGEGPRTSVSIADPRQLMDDPAFAELAAETAQRLEKALGSLDGVVTG